MAPPSERAGPDREGDVQQLPFDALHEILMRLPAKELCRFRAVCRPWRSLLSDPGFFSAHAARHLGPPLIVAGYDPSDRGGILCDIVDLSGRVVTRVRSPGGGTVMEWAVSADLDFIQIMGGTSTSCRLLNLATGALSSLPASLAEEHAAEDLWEDNYRPTIVFGKVPSTGEYKVLRVLDDNCFDYPPLCEVFTLDGSNNSRWRAKKASSHPIRGGYFNFSSVVINGIVYFLSSEVIVGGHASQKRIASFDLETEEWRAILLGPLISLVGIGWQYGLFDNDVSLNRFSLAALNECLVLVHCRRPSSMNLWFLMDLEKSSWVKQHSIQIDPVASGGVIHTHPLLVLNDGRIVIYSRQRGVLIVWDPRTSACTYLAAIRPHCGIGLYTGSLLSVGNKAN